MQKHSARFWNAPVLWRFCFEQVTRSLNWLWLLAIVFAASPLGAAEPANSPDIDALIRSADQWAKENLDEDALRVLRSVDQAKVKQIFGELQKQFRGQYVFDLAGLKETARALVPVLESYEET